MVLKWPNQTEARNFSKQTIFKLWSTVYSGYCQLSIAGLISNIIQFQCIMTEIQKK